jgi:hypothetical protein
MPYEITFDNLPAGISLGHTREGQQGKVLCMEFTSSEDGQMFVQRLEGFPNDILAKVTQTTPLRPSQVDHMLAIIRKDKTATVYVNELSHLVTIRMARRCEAGQEVYKDDIIDLNRLELDGITVPNDCGVAFVFSVGWRKGFLFDFMPLGPEGTPRTYDYSRLFGQLYAHVMFQERFSISDVVWEKLLTAQWFPFVALKSSTIDMLINYATADWDLDELIPAINTEVREKLSEWLESWRQHPYFKAHMEIINKAAEHYQNGDFLSCTALLYPRIEGIMRSNLLGSSGAKATQTNLSSGAVAAQKENPMCLLLPQKFQQYLEDVYFASFDPMDPKIEVSRNSVSHGTADTENFNAKAALLGILIVNHLFFCFDEGTAIVTSVGKEP